MLFNKNISLFNFLVFLFFIAGIIVFFINNILTVNSLITEIENMKNELKKTKELNLILKTEIQKLSTYENIKNVAVNKLNLTFSPNIAKKIIIKKSELY